ncbi:mitochondrial intermembrane space import and assembly protein 40-like protein [Rozella allomycis CSF55]|uniref:Mitochondrial intermembrane space import and assembly protein 40 n=1 Tax=Rozella allomycis (strain CSF55) TaxID=988480 RepID=A0A4P9YKG9_ROZAC|nr:mitochondrial intermembrane space import and assembly protein 40-like protein [Rozella allomycis CSF55]
MSYAKRDEKDTIIFVTPEDSKILADSDKLEQEKDQDNGHMGAVNEETGEINWDCPCLAEAIKPPCGEFFKSAFSCFVNSKSEPQGQDCIDHFMAMKECYQSYPEIYLKDEEDETVNNEDSSHTNNDEASALDNSDESSVTSTQ